MAVQNLPAKTSLTNPHFVKTWHSATSKTVQEDPRDQSALYLQFGLNELLTYVHHNGVVEQPIAKREEIRECFRRAGTKGDARGMFFEGLTLIEGFGCQQDSETGSAFVLVAAKGRKCDLALSFLNRILGLEFLLGQNREQDFASAIQSFRLAGEIAAPELELVKNHVQAMHMRLLQRQAQERGKVITLEQPYARPMALRK